MAGSAVITTSASSATMKNAAAVSTRTQPRRVRSARAAQHPLLAADASELHSRSWMRLIGSLLRWLARKCRAGLLAEWAAGDADYAARAVSIPVWAWGTGGMVKRGRVVTADLTARARAGDDEAFRELVEPYRRELQVHCYRILGSLQDAEDALQETLLAAWQGLGGFEGRASIRTWLYRVATRRCLNALRSARRRPAMAGRRPASTCRSQPGGAR